MPSIRMLVRKEKYKRTTPKDREELGLWCREVVAGTIGDEPDAVPVDYVELLWVVYEGGQNTNDLTVEVLFSIGANGFNPPQERIEHMVERVENWLSQTDLAAPFDSIAVWARPQPDAVFSEFTRG